MNDLYLNNLLIILAFSITFISQIIVSLSYSKYKKKLNNKDQNGYDVARKILDKNGLEDIMILETKGNLTDHYDPTKKVIKLSTDIYHGSSIASVSVAAHECGHAIQDKDNYKPMRIRSKLVPTVNISTRAGYIALVIGLLFSSKNLALFGVALLAVMLLFQLVTLPVEFNASTRAVAQLSEMNILYGNEEKAGARKVLTAAALTYVAGAVVAIAELLRLIMIFNSRNND